MRKFTKGIITLMAVTTMCAALVGCKDDSDKKAGKKAEENVMELYAEKIKQDLGELYSVSGIRGGEIFDANNDGIDDVYVTFESEYKQEYLYMKVGDKIEVLGDTDTVDIYSDKSSNRYVAVEVWNDKRQGYVHEVYIFDKKGNFEEKKQFDDYIEMDNFMDDNGLNDVKVESSEYVYLKKENDECTKEVILEWLNSMKE